MRPANQKVAPIRKNLHRLDLPLKDGCNSNFAFLDAIEEAISPLMGLREILCKISKPGTEGEACLKIIAASLQDLDYVIKKWRE